ncbi:MAG: caspase domain-containing protein, partial [Myxococcota bacterium]
MTRERQALRKGLGLGLGVLACACALGSSPALAQDEAPVRHALVIGANDGGGTLTPLRYAERDAEQIVDVLTELGGFREDRVTVLYQPNRETVQAALAHHAALAEAADDDLFVLYYSGHADAQGLRLGPETYWFDSLKHDLRDINSTARLGVLDACRSGSITRFKGAKVAPSLFAGQDRLAATGEVWLTATSADEVAQESESLRGGFFTHYLVSGLRGAADTGDGLVDVDELRKYTYDKVVARSGQAGATQRPHFDVNLSGSQGLALTDVRRADATLILDQGGPGQVSVLRVADRTQLAEVEVTPDRDVRLALPAGRYFVRRRDRDGELWEAQVALTSSLPVEVTSWRSVTAEMAMARGTSKVDAFQNRVRHYRERSQGFVEDLNLGESPTVAGSLSLLVPGGGQLYNGERTKAVAYFLGTASIIGGATVFSLGSNDGRRT